ncbi:MAG TPA: histidine kinase [Sphingobacteriaceae bacterium]|nr:histidine kinase [Sphingobacteriaceae bacterium]
MKVIQILNNKPQEIYSVNRGTSILDALTVMMEKNISALLIIEEGVLHGIFSERDYARKIILQGKSSKDTMISEVMSSNLITVTQQDSIDHCMQLMTDKHIRHLPVVENGKVLGLISIGDIVKNIIEEQKQTIEQLQTYIHS